jgi:hypothetical protein
MQQTVKAAVSEIQSADECLDDFRKGDDGDYSHLAAAAWAGERKSLMDPRDQQRPGTPVSPYTGPQGTKDCLIRT